MLAIPTEKVINCDSCGRRAVAHDSASGINLCGDCATGQPLPRLYLSLRQPWAWLVVNGYKPIENRDWYTNVRGLIGIHAAKRMTNDDYCACQLFVRGFAPEIADAIPPAAALKRGGIVGQALLTDCVSRNESPWFCGPFGLVLADAQPRPFTPCNGALGFFRLVNTDGQLTPLWGKCKES